MATQTGYRYKYLDSYLLFCNPVLSPPGGALTLNTTTKANSLVQSVPELRGLCGPENPRNSNTSVIRISRFSAQIQLTFGSFDLF